MEERAESGVAFSHMAILATLSVVALISIAAWQAWGIVAGGNTVSATNSTPPPAQRAATPWEGIDWQAPLAEGPNAEDPDGLSNIEDNVASALLSSYVALSEGGIYTPQDGEKIAGDIAATLRAKISYSTYSAGDIKTDADTSYDRMLVYRSDLREALEPLLANPGYELNLFANYIESRDATYTEQLKQAAENYRVAVANAASIIVPADALSHHVSILNALSEFGATVEAMAKHADDAFASAALLSTYNASERNLLLSFDALATYQKNKTI